MAENTAPSMYDQFVGQLGKLSDVYAKVTLAQKGVATAPIAYETRNSAAPLVQSGQPAAIVGNDPLANALDKVASSASQAYIAKQASDSMPYVVGLVALGITIYLLTK